MPNLARSLDHGSLPFNVDASNDAILRGINRFKGWTMDWAYPLAGQTLNDGTAYFLAIHIPRAATITGLAFIQQTQGSYTADNTNQVALYTSDGVTLNRVAASADNATLWKAANNAVILEPFTSPYSAAPGLYYLGLLYNNSAQVTQPQLYRGQTSVAGIVNANVSGSVIRSGTLAAQTSLPGQQALSGLSQSGIVWCASAY